MTDFNLVTYTLQIFAPEREDGYRRTEENKRVVANLPAYVETWQEDMSDLLPEGYTVKITEWQEMSPKVRSPRTE